MAEGEAAQITVEGLTLEQEYGWYVTLTDSSGNSSTSATALFTTQTTEPKLDSNVKIFHSLNLASDIAINYAVKVSDLTQYNSYYMECVLPVYEGNTFVGTEVVTLQPELRGSYYYFVLDGLTSLEMNNMVEATLHMRKGGKTMSLESKVIVRFVMNATNYTGDLSKLSLRVSFVNISGETETVTLTNCELFNAARNYYVFDFDGLLSAEMRSVMRAAVYEGDTQLSPTLVYSIDTYGTNTTGALRTLVQAMVAYGDSANAFFS